jgi:putative phage-type endonuclease
MNNSAALQSGETAAGKQILPAPTTDQERQTWLALRNTGLGASDMSTVLGLNKWQTPLQLWLEKTGQKPPAKETPAMWIGKALEPAADAWFRKETGLDTYQTGLWQSKDHTWMLATPDRGIDGHNALLELKTTNARMASLWDDEQTSDHAEIQVQQQMAVTNADVAYVVVFIGGWNLRFELRVVKRDQTVIDHLTQAGEHFMSLILEGTPPPFTDTEESGDIDLTYPHLEGERRELEKEMVNLYRSYERLTESATSINATRKEVETQRKAVINQLREHLKGATIPTIDDQPIGVFKTVPRGGYTVTPGSYTRFFPIKPKN